MEMNPHPRTETDERMLAALRQLIADGKVKNERQFALELGLNPGVVYKVRQGIQSFPGEVPFEMATRWGVSPDHIRFGIGSLYQDGQIGAMAEKPAYSMLPFVDVRAKATFVSEFSTGQPLDRLERVAVLLDPVLGKLRDALLIEVEGDSMAPTLQPRDRLVVTAVNRADWEHQSGGVYVFVFSDQVAVKRLASNNLADQGYLHLTSDNPQGGALTVRGADVLGLYRIRQLLRVF